MKMQTSATNGLDVNATEVQSQSPTCVGCPKQAVNRMCNERIYSIRAILRYEKHLPVVGVLCLCVLRVIE